jgi:hypothetical protein
MTIMHFSCQEREKKEKTQTIDHRRQSNHDMSTRAPPCGRGHVSASIYMTDSQIWPPRSVSRAFLMVRVPPTHWNMWNTRQQLFN